MFCEFGGIMFRRNLIAALILTLFLGVVIVSSCAKEDEDERQSLQSDDDYDGGGSPGGDTPDYDDLVWVDIPGGTFDMGCSFGDEDCNYYEEPRHDVTLSPFQMIETEITQRQMNEVLGFNPSYHSGCPGCPVEYVTHDEARKFCSEVGGRLPTEAQWEFAARGGENSRFYCGHNEACLGDIAWYDENSNTVSRKVKGKDPNAYGLYDMLGNVFEWVRDYWDSNYYEEEVGENPTGPTDGKYRVIRGGSYYWGYYYLRASYRSYTYAHDQDSDLGFRCVRGVE